ncbi:unnamed protein product [Vitrella brassicaformis CCMP3155]|uniref:tRNA-dihydrouridine synthase n=1 Tax=Vitrella brassicaformis (strain CCMP3155) TaxID=1169540 RepID=A0A0G4ELS3_VITBC|nr:unnamed protein product [Vitrella brassicaformis CCMP3155]|eukprot:CEL98066.1 unnamed protein product [Vitrella brassicaformis CCMP3155]
MLGRLAPRAAAATAAVDMHRFSVAPMMDYTDKHFRFLMRLLTRNATLYTEMMAANALHYTNRQAAADATADSMIPRSLATNAESIESPCVLQLGGSDPDVLAEASRTASAYHPFTELNLNCGCPSERVAGKGAFGAALMREPALVAELCKAMRQGGGRPTTVKCRIGVDDQDSFEELQRFISTVAERAGVSHFIIHSRKAILTGLSPEQNRKIPPLIYEYVYRLVEGFPGLRFTLNGGVLTYEDIDMHFERCPTLTGVMVGRAVLDRPFYWSEVDSRLYGRDNLGLNRREVLAAYGSYCDAEMERTDPSRQRSLRNLLLKHALNLFAGEPMSRKYKQRLEALRQRGDVSVSAILREAEEQLHEGVLERRPGSGGQVAADCSDSVLIGRETGRCL